MSAIDADREASSRMHQAMEMRYAMESCDILRKLSFFLARHLKDIKEYVCMYVCMYVSIDGYVSKLIYVIYVYVVREGEFIGYPPQSCFELSEGVDRKEYETTFLGSHVPRVGVVCRSSVWPHLLCLKSMIQIFVGIYEIYLWCLLEPMLL